MGPAVAVEASPMSRQQASGRASEVVMAIPLSLLCPRVVDPAGPSAVRYCLLQMAFDTGIRTRATVASCPDIVDVAVL